MNAEMLLVLLIPVLALATGLVAVFRMPRKAFLPKSSASKSSTDLEARVRLLEEEVTGLRQELSETQERLDFTERLLTKNDQSRRLADGG